MIFSCTAEAVLTKNHYTQLQSPKMHRLFFARVVVSSSHGKNGGLHETIPRPHGESTQYTLQHFLIQKMLARARVDLCHVSRFSGLTESASSRNVTQQPPGSLTADRSPAAIQLARRGFRVRCPTRLDGDSCQGSSSRGGCHGSLAAERVMRRSVRRSTASLCPAVTQCPTLSHLKLPPGSLAADRSPAAIQLTRRGFRVRCPTRLDGDSCQGSSSRGG